MKELYFIILLFFFVSCNKDNSEFKIQKSFTVRLGNNFITPQDCFCLSSDSVSFSFILYYSYGEQRYKSAIDTFDYSDIQYGAKLYGFKSSVNNSNVVLLKIENEFFPTFKVYYVKEGKLIKIGYWGVFTPCDTCDFQDYLIEDIRIFQRNNKIVFLFLEDVKYLNYENLHNDSWEFFKAKTLMLPFNINAKSLKNKRE
jgi:hypothetical protein